MEREDLARVFVHLKDIERRTREAAIAGDLASLRSILEGYAAVSDRCLEVSGTISPAHADGVRGEWVRHDDSDPERRLLYIHGGGWVAGSIESYRPLASRISRAAGCVVFTVDYRLAPEHPFPACVDDCMTAYEWMLDHGPEGGGRACLHRR